VHKRTATALIIAASLFAGFAAGTRLHRPLPAPHRNSQIRLDQGEFTNPLLECEVGNSLISSEKISFGSQLETIAKQSENQLAIEKIAIYFRDLNNGPTFGAHYDDPFIPASLLKVPVMMQYYKLREINPKAWDQTLTATTANTASVNDQQIQPEETLTAGTAYSIEELLEKMIRYSDNASAELLTENLPLGTLSHLYQLLGVDAIAANDPIEPLTPKEYSSFFRILFNASYLSIEDSESALKLLSETTFDQGLVAGVPKTVPIAHKYGERLLTDLGQQQVHDCGIVYYPRHPYLLCVMTRGHNQESQIKAIKDVSTFVYSEIAQQYKNEKQPKRPR
jgi:beta-lactamase class A